MPERRLLLATMLFLAACGPSGGMGGGGDDNGGDDDDYNGPTGSVSGTVWAPGNAPGMVPPGQEIPISGALVYLSLNPPDAIPSGVYCDQCVTTPGDSALSDSKGRFVLSGIAPNTYWLVIQKGQFRLDQQVTVVAEQELALTTEQSTLPSIHDPANGKWRPHVALAEGLWDDIENIMGKMDFGEVDGSGELIGTSAAGNFDLYENGYGSHGDVAIGDLNALISDLEKMKTYHIIFVPCSDGDNTLLFTNPQLRANILEYVKLGGKFYVTDWSAEWEDTVFPEYIQFVSDHDTTSASGPYSDGDGFPGYTSYAAKAADPDLASWLDGQTGPLVDDLGTNQVGTIDADAFAVEGNWDHIDRLNSIDAGVNDEGMTITETPYAWVMGDWDIGEGAIHPLTVTFEPAGCGRVLYSTYHTAGYSHVGLLPQERVLLYLIMEIGECVDQPIIG